MTASRHIVAVHGFMFRDDDGQDDPDRVFWPEIVTAFGQAVEMWTWYSVPFGIHPETPLASFLQTVRAWAGSWGRGYLHPYRYAWALSTDAGDRLGKHLRARHAVTGERVTLVGHSLGSRVVLRAAAMAPQTVERILLLSGAELQQNAAVLAGLLPVPILNVATREDDVLRILGAHCAGDGDGACIGQAGLGDDAPANWLDLFLDDLNTQAVGRKLGWDLQGDQPGEWGDHWHCYRHAGNWPALRAWVNGDALAAFRHVKEDAEYAPC